MTGPISEDDLLTFEGFLKRQGVNDPAAITADDLKVLRALFDASLERQKTGPKVGLMKLKPRALGEQRYAVAIRDGSALWLTLWIRCKPKDDVIIMYPRADRDWQPHASYHASEWFHQKSFGVASPFTRQKRQPLTAAFRGSEHLGTHGGHGTSSGADCDPNAFDAVVEVEPGILGSVGVDLVEPGYEATWSRDDTDQRFYLYGVHQREVFPQNGRPSVAITIQR